MERANTAGDDDNVIRLEGVAKRFSTPAGTVVALERVDLSIPRGRLVVVLGPSGCGKTTLLNVIGALDRPTEGEVTVDGRRLSQLSRAQLFAYRRDTVAFVFQAFNLFPELTALENVRFGAERGDRSNADRVAAEMLDRVGLGERLHHFPHQLSGGEQQRVAIARSLATGNPVMLADEPTGELDFATVPGVAWALPARRVSDTIRDVLALVNGLFVVLQVVIGVLAFLVGYNSAKVGVDERARENATMMAFGVPVRSIVAAAVAESILLGVVAAGIGLAVGQGLLAWILESVLPTAVPDLAVIQSVNTSSYLVTVGIGAAAMATAPLFLARQLRRTNLTSTLRYVE